MVRYKKYPDWYYAVKDRGLEIVNFKAFNRNAEFFGSYIWPDKGGYLMSSATEYVPDTLKLDVESIAHIDRIWLMNPDSSNIKYAAFDFLNDRLFLQFHSSDEEKPDIYCYPDIPIEFWIAMTQAESVGKFFHQNKKLLVAYSKVEFKKKKKKKG